MNTLAIWSPRPDANPVESISPHITLFGLPVINITEKPFEPAVVALAEAFIFVSHHAVKHFLAQVPKDTLLTKTCIAIGKRTADTLNQHGISPQLTAPPPFNSEALLADKSFQNLAFQHFALIGGVGGRTLLQDTLTQREKRVLRIECYQRDKANLLPQDMVQFVHERTIGGIILSSGEVCKAVADNLIKADLRQAFSLPVFTFSERIATRAQQLGFCDIHIAEQADQHFLYQRIINWWEGELR